MFAEIGVKAKTEVWRNKSAIFGSMGKEWGANSLSLALRESLPSSTNCIIIVAVNGLVIEAIRKKVLI